MESLNYNKKRCFVIYNLSVSFISRVLGVVGFLKEYAHRCFYHSRMLPLRCCARARSLRTDGTDCARWIYRWWFRAPGMHDVRVWICLCASQLKTGCYRRYFVWVDFLLCGQFSYCVGSFPTVTNTKLDNFFRSGKDCYTY